MRRLTLAAALVVAAIPLSGTASAKCAPDFQVFCFAYGTACNLANDPKIVCDAQP